MVSCSNAQLIPSGLFRMTSASLVPLRDQTHYAYVHKQMSSLKLASAKLIIQKYNQTFVKGFVTYRWLQQDYRSDKSHRASDFEESDSEVTDFQWTPSNYIQATSNYIQATRDNLVIGWEQSKMTCREEKPEKSRLVGVREPCKNEKCVREWGMQSLPLSKHSSESDTPI